MLYRPHSESDSGYAMADPMYTAQHLGALLEQAPGFLAFLRGPTHVFEVVNRAYYQVVGRHDLIGKTVRDALPEMESQGIIELLDRVYTTGEAYVGTSISVRLHRTVDAPEDAVLDFIYQPIRDDDGATIGILVQGHEVTQVAQQQRKREAAETALRASEQRYRTLFEAIDDGFCLMQMLFDDAGRCTDYRFLEANAAFEGHTGLHEAVGKTARELVPDLDPSWFELYGKVAITGEPARFENHAPAMNRWFDVYANRVGEPELRQVALVFKDVTARKAAEAETAALLEREREARREAEAAGRLRDEFLATVSHELRTPLSSILGWAQMMRTHELPPEKRAKALETIERNARAQAQLIEDLLDVSRILSGQMRLEVAPVDVRVVTEAAVDTVRPAAMAKNIRIVTTLATDALVLGDAHRLQQIAWNLLSNAVKFTPKGGRVQVALAVEASSIVLTVADTGRGIAPDFLDHVFDRFRQADSSSTRTFGGLGLGLSIVRELVTLHGGTVEADSEGADRGATFTVRLPLSVTRRRDPSLPSATVPVPAPSQLSHPPELAGVRILVLDDETDTREMLRELIASCEAEVVVAASVAEALELVRRAPPDIVLSDIGMPGEDGYAFVKKLRALPAESGGAVPAIALTAFARVDDRARALHEGFDNHVTKPVEPIELLAVLASFARRQRR